MSWNSDCHKIRTLQHSPFFRLSLLLFKPTQLKNSILLQTENQHKKISKTVKNNIFIQDGVTIKTLHPENMAKAIIYDEEQRNTILHFIRDSYFPHHTAVGKGNATSKRWNVEEYRGRVGQGYRMITYSPYSSKLNHITYFIKIL